jgi:hypothetical protein
VVAFASEIEFTNDSPLLAETMGFVDVVKSQFLATLDAKFSRRSSSDTSHRTSGSRFSLEQVSPRLTFKPSNLIGRQAHG